MEAKLTRQGNGYVLTVYVPDAPAGSVTSKGRPIVGRCREWVVVDGIAISPPMLLQAEDRAPKPAPVPTPRQELTAINGNGYDFHGDPVEILKQLMSKVPGLQTALQAGAIGDALQATPAPVQRKRAARTVVVDPA